VVRAIAQLRALEGTLLVFKCQHFARKICLTFTGLMMRWKTRNYFPRQQTVTDLLAAIFVAFNYEK